MRNIKKYLIFILPFFFLFLSYVPLLYEASVIDLLPANRTIVWGEHIYTYDYNVYLSKIRQGTEDRWNVVDKYDNNPRAKGVFLQMLYLLSGKVGGVVRLPPQLTYHLLRTILAVLWILTIIYINTYFLKKRSLSFLGITLSLLTSSFPLFYRFNNEWWVGQYMNWWQELDIIKRVSFIPHDTLNYIIVALLSIILYQYKKYQQKIVYWIMLSIIFISVFIHPAGPVLFFFLWCWFQFISLIWSGSLNRKNLSRVFTQTVGIVIAITIPLLYIYSVTSSYPWKSLIDYDVSSRLIWNVKEYILALGPIFFTGLLGMVLVLKKKEERFLSLCAWILAVVTSIVVFKFFPLQSELRFIQTANHIPLAILSVYLFSWLFKQKQLVRYTAYGVIGIIIVLGILQSFYSLKAQTQYIHQRAVATIPLIPNPPQVMYPLTDFYNGLVWLEKNTPRSSVVLSKFTAGNYIPAYAGNFVYLGHSTETPFLEHRKALADAFFSGTLNENQANRFLYDNSISYIFYGPQEREYVHFDIGKYLFLTPVYQTSLVVIYKVK